ncbi:hypothetical protein C8R44DRAFT_636016 [Mycena epipterygia]|nr:hypothetical protein C8R44DRAFT_636016 [Mycena epipterygia]
MSENRRPRIRKSTGKVRENRDTTAAKSKARTAEKTKKAHRRVLRDHQNENNLVVERPDDSEELKELRTALANARGERDAAEALVARSMPLARGPPARSVPKPHNMSRVTVNDVREHLGLAGADNDQTWSDLRTSIRRFMDVGMLDKSCNWKGQDSRRLIKIYDAASLFLVEEAHPDLERFHSQWGTSFLVHESFLAQKTYQHCKRKDGMYRARARERRLETSRLCRIDEEGFAGTGPRAPSEYFIPNPLHMP